MNRRALLEAILFVCGEPTAVSAIAAWMEIPEAEVFQLARQPQEGSGLVIRRLDDRLQLATSPVYAEKLKAIFQSRSEERLSNSLLETLTIIAYRQPVTRQEVDDIRGVNSAYAIAALRERGLVEKTGVREVLGRPSLYGTTAVFLQQFNLSSLADLPPLPGGEEKANTDKARKEEE